MLGLGYTSPSLLTSVTCSRSPRLPAPDQPGGESLQRPVQPELECRESRRHRLIQAHIQEVDCEEITMEIIYLYKNQSISEKIIMFLSIVDRILSTIDISDRH